MTSPSQIYRRLWCGITGHDWGEWQQFRVSSFHPIGLFEYKLPYATRRCAICKASEIKLGDYVV